MSNTIAIKDNRVIKTFGSHMSYVKETQIYEKIKGLGLAPELTGTWDGAIEHVYIYGKDFGEIMRRAYSNPYDFVSYAKLFFEWYKKFREAVKLSLGDMDFSDFIVGEDSRLYCIDFEHCKPATVEQDIAGLVSVIALDGNTYSRLPLENAKIFAKIAYQELDISSEKLYHAVKLAMQNKCEALGIKSINSANEYLASFVSCSFVHKPRYGSELPEMIEALKCSSHMWTIFAEDVNLEDEKEIRQMMSADKENVDVLFITQNGGMKDYPFMIRTDGAGKLLQQANANKINFKLALISNFRCKGFAVENI